MNDQYADYIACRIVPVATAAEAAEETADIIIAELAALGFESFESNEQGIHAYIPEKTFSPETEEEIGAIPQIASFSIEKIKGENWNAVWESNFSPIVLEGKCRIRADFHEPDPAFPIEIIINPKMSFGTGHHATTFLVMEQLFEMPVSGKSVLDMGCGTGILAILAAKLGASKVTAIDNDPQCIVNTVENTGRNDCPSIGVELLDGALPVMTSRFGIIIANIQRNVLLDQMGWYADCLEAGGLLIVSGIYLKDLEDIVAEADKCGLAFMNNTMRNDWTAARFRKK